MFGTLALHLSGVVQMWSRPKRIIVVFNLKNPIATCAIDIFLTFITVRISVPYYFSRDFTKFLQDELQAAPTVQQLAAATVCTYNTHFDVNKQVQ